MQSAYIHSWHSTEHTFYLHTDNYWVVAYLSHVGMRIQRTHHTDELFCCNTDGAMCYSSIVFFYQRYYCLESEFLFCCSLDIILIQFSSCPSSPPLSLSTSVDPLRVSCPQQTMCGIVILWQSWCVALPVSWCSVLGFHGKLAAVYNALYGAIHTQCMLLSQTLFPVSLLSSLCWPSMMG